MVNCEMLLQYTKCIQSKDVFFSSHYTSIQWKWRDIRPSMVTHTRNSCSAFNPSKCTHTVVNTHTPWTHTHTPWTHTPSSGQPFMLRRPGSSWGFGALLKGTSVVVLKVERALYIHSPHLQFLPARDSNSQPLDYESESITIRPWLPPVSHDPSESILICWFGAQYCKHFLLSILKTVVLLNILWKTWYISLLITKYFL